MATDQAGPDYPAAPVRNQDTIIDWWTAVAYGDAMAVAEKLRAYGSLNFHAQCLLALVGRPHGSMREGTEMVLASYIAGKLNRLFEGLSHGELPNEDSWADLARYAMMARYVRKFGEWP